jgi:hypothetical protein
MWFLLLMLMSAAALPAAPDGFVSLMPKQDVLEHWIIEGTPPETWQARDGMIYCTGRPNGFLRSRKVYRDFVFRAEWRFQGEGWTEGPEFWPNAGFFINAHEVAGGWPRSLEVQGHYGEAASLFGVRGGKVSGAKRGPIVSKRPPLGEWDRVEVTSQNGQVKIMLNGELVNEGSNIEPRDGNVCLQSEGWPLWYRNVEIKELQ